MGERAVLARFRASKMLASAVAFVMVEAVGRGIFQVPGEHDPGRA